MQRQGAGDRALDAPDHLGFYILMRGERPMRIAGVCRRASELSIVAQEVRGEEGVGLFDGGDAFKPHRFDEAVLERAIGPLDPPFGLGRVGADDLDAELV